MEGDFLYRYISFETFVGMVQKNALTFVLPSVWDDPQEAAPFFEYAKKINSGIEYALQVAVYNKIYAQCWTELSESDAMWRIYSYNNRAIRIKIERDVIQQLDNVEAVPVVYSDDSFARKETDEQTYLSSLAYKRSAFSHEREVRLINRYKYRDNDDAEQHVKALWFVYNEDERRKIIESVFPGMETKEKVKKLFELLNMGKECQTTKDISYSHIQGFLKGVLVHPLAPGWYVEIVKEFCNRNDIPFEGKSELYA